MTQVSDFITLAQTLSLDNVDAFVDCYAQDAVFTDPFQTVHGRDEVRRVYLEMLRHLHLPQFRNVRVISGPTPPAGQACEIMLGWHFEFAIAPGKPRTTIAGCSLLRLDQQGKIVEHCDYWDASRLMQAFPVIGQVIGWLRKKIGQPDRS